MKTTLQKLTDKLCEVEAIREDIEWIEINKHYPAPIQLHHLLWYCEEKGYAGAVGINGKFIGNRQVSGSYTEIQLDITKDLSNQSEEVLEAILNFITG